MKKIILNCCAMCITAISLGQIPTIREQYFDKSKTRSFKSPEKKELTSLITIEELQEFLSIDNLDAKEDVIAEIKMLNNKIEAYKALNIQLDILKEVKKVCEITKGTIEVDINEVVSYEVDSFLKEHYTKKKNEYEINLNELQVFLNFPSLNEQSDFTVEIKRITNKIDQIDVDTAEFQIELLGESTSVFEIKPDKSIVVKQGVYSDSIADFIKENTVTSLYNITKEELQEFKEYIEASDSDDATSLLKEFKALFQETNEEVFVNLNHNLEVLSPTMKHFLNYQLIQTRIADPIFFNYYTSKVDSLKKRIKKLKNRVVSDYEEQQTKYNLIKKTKEEIEHSKVYLKVYDSLRIASIEDEGTKFVFPTSLPARGRALAFEHIYAKDVNRGLYFANNANLQINDNGAIVQSELISAFLGPLKVSFGALISNTLDANSEDNQENTGTDEMMGTETQIDEKVDATQAFQRLVSSGGGNTYLNVEFPLLFHQDKRFFFYMNATGRLGLEVAEFSNDVDTSTGNASLYSNVYTSVSTDNNEFSFFANASFGMYVGGNSYYDRLNIEDKDVFFFGEVKGGITIQSKIRFALTFQTFGSEENLRSGQVLVGVQLLSDILKSKSK